MNAIYEIKKYFLLILTIQLFSIPMAKAEEFSAILTWSKRVELSTPVSGVVKQVFAKTGKIVAKGDVLIQLDPRSFKADLKYAKAKFKNTNEQSLEAKRELDRQLDMYDRSMLSEHDLQTAKNNYTAAQSNYLQAQASLKKAKLNLEHSAIRAPFNAIVIKTTSVKGQVVASDISPPILVTVAEAHRMLARFYVPSNKVNDFILKQGVEVNVAGENYQARIFNIALEPEASRVDYAVDVIFDYKDKILRAGQKAIINL